LTLLEAKQLLASVQRAIVSGQVDSHGQLRPCCRSCGGKCHLKDWRGHCIATLFGEVTVQPSALTGTDPLSLMKADPSDARFVGE